MKRMRSPFELAAGKLISTIQKEWGRHMGVQPDQDQAEAVVELAHDILKTRTSDGALALLNGKSVVDYLGKQWVVNHPLVIDDISVLESVLRDNSIHSPVLKSL